MAEKTRLLQVVNIPFVLPYYFGDQIAYLKEMGFDVTIACSPGEKLDKFCNKYEVDQIDVNIVRRIDIRSDFSSLIKLIKLIRQDNYDVVIGHTPKGGLLSMLAARWVGVPNRVYFRHGIVYATSSGLKRWLMVLLERLTCICATKVVSVSKSVLAFSQSKKINSSHKDVLLHMGTCNGIDLERFKQKRDLNFERELGIGEEDIVVGYVGRLVNDKGIKELVEAWHILKGRNKNLWLLLVGPFEERDALPEYVKNQILNDPSIIFTNLVDDTVPYYTVMDIFVLPSYREGFPTVVLEASAMGIPVVTTRSIGCIDSIKENETGVFTEISAEDIAAKIQFYIENDHARFSHGQKGRLWVEENFNQDVVWDAILKEVL